MKMRKSEHFTRSSSSIQGQAFNVKFTDKMFETLFSSLYRYKEAAAMRETVCNAIDSHNMRDRMQRTMACHYTPLTPPPARYSKYLAPKGTRVVVHLPDDFEPWLEIKDFGVGLSLEQIIGEAIAAQEDEVLIQGNMIVKEDEIPDSAEVIGEPGFYNGRLVFRREDGEIIRSPGLYTTLFHSTKEEDDGQIGAFGLGSKSPFAVSDSFTVESRMEGKLHRFLMYLNANRIPTVDLITKDINTRDPLPEDTSEFNGLTVKIPVKNSRFRSFADELMRIGRVMKPSERPVVENQPYYFEWEDISYGHRVNNTYIQPKDAGDIHYAVMGGVSYPIDLSQLDTETSSIMSKFPCSYTFFPLGSLNVPPSREDLSYDEYTRETLCKEFRVVASSIMKDKMKELEEACRRGPLALFMEKAKLSEMFGSGFRKLVEKEYPADRRFQHNSYTYQIPVAIERDFDHTAPFTDIPHPFALEVHEECGTYSNLAIHDISNWAGSGQHITVVVEDSIRARNLKLKQLRDTGTVVIVVKPNDRYVQHRNNSKGCPAFKNHEEVHKYYESWVGTEETTVNYLAFADTFVEFLSDVLPPTDVKFLSELAYTTPPVEKEPGLYPFDCHHFNLEKYKEIKAEDISAIINEGKKVIYIEISGHDCIHQIGNRTLNEAICREIRDALHTTIMEVDEDGQHVSLREFLNAHMTIFLARRKSVPMMKKYPEVFVPIDQVYDMLAERNGPMVRRRNARDILKLHKSLQIANARLGYGAHLLKEIGVSDDKYQGVLERHQAHLDKMNSLLDPKTIRTYREIQQRKFDNIQAANFRKFMEIVKTLRVDTPTTDAEREVFNTSYESRRVFGEADDILGEYGFRSFRYEQTVGNNTRKLNRLNIERHRVIRFLKENYVPSAHNPIEDQNAFMETISKQLARA